MSGPAGFASDRRTADESRKARRIALARARRCTTCSSADPIGREVACIGCQAPTTTWTCAPGYCRACSHDPAWIPLAEVLR